MWRSSKIFIQEFEAILYLFLGFEVLNESFIALNPASSHKLDLLFINQSLESSLHLLRLLAPPLLQKGNLSPVESVVGVGLQCRDQSVKYGLNHSLVVKIECLQPPCV